VIASAAAVGVLADRRWGEPPAGVHPVAWFGRAMAATERWTWRDDRRAGVGHVAIGVGAAWLAGVALGGVIGPGPATALATAVAVAGRMLDTEALAVGALLAAGDLDAARHRVQALVGRDTAALDAAGVARAVVESVAENSTDAVIAPAVWAAVGGAPAVLAHRAVNTLDAMIGHRTPRYERFGWAAARLDDVANAVPAVVGAALVVVRHPARWRAVGRAVGADAGRHPSPNAGLIEGAFAGALDVTLGGANRYAGAVEDRGRLGTGPAPVLGDIARAVQLRRWLGLAAAGGLLAIDVIARRAGGRAGGPTSGWHRAAS
jgi:adenosylcobinamide-phosphate synthase